MTVSPDARTPSADVHALSGSSAGPGRPFAPLADVHELPDPFVPLGDAAAGVMAGLAARRPVPHPDAEVIDLAGRVKRLAEREQRLWARTSGIEDAALKAMPPKPKRAETRARITTEFAKGADGSRLTTIREPAGWEAEIKASGEEHDAAIAAWERRREAEEARRRLPWWAKLRDRATDRLSRWGSWLSSMEPVTEAGIAAKAAASLAVGEGGSLFDPWRQQLASSLGRDALRVIGAACDRNEREHRARDTELFSLIERHAAGTAEWDAADEACEPISRAWWESRPAMPAALRYSTMDYPFEANGREAIEGSASVYVVYLESDVDRLRTAPDPFRRVERREPAPWNAEETIVRTERVPDERLIYRKAEILAAWDGWRAEIERLRETTGLKAASVAIEAIADRVEQIEDAIAAFSPQTLAGLQAKARWIASTPEPQRHVEHLLRDVCAMPDATPLQSADLASAA